MPLPSSFENAVSSRQREDGEDDFHSGSVTDFQPGPSELTAHVYASGRHTVHLQSASGGIACECSCNDFRTLRVICRHIWAVLLAADEKDLMQGWPPREGDRPIPVVPEEAESDDDSEEPILGGPINERRIATQTKPLARRADWRSHLSDLRETMRRGDLRQAEPTVPHLELWYIIDGPASLESAGIVIDLVGRDPQKTGEAKDRPWSIDPETISLLPDPSDREILSRLHGASTAYSQYYDTAAADHRFHLRKTQAADLLAAMCGTGRCLLRSDDFDSQTPMQWDDGPAWTLHLRVEEENELGRYFLQGELRREKEVLQFTDVPLLTRSGLLCTRSHVARFDDRGGRDWITFLRRHGKLSIPQAQADDLLKELMDLPHVPPLDLPEPLRPETIAPTPRPRLRIETPRQTWEGPQRLVAHLVFDYQGTLISLEHPGAGLYLGDRRRMVLRDRAAEAAALAQLVPLGFKLNDDAGRRELTLAPRQLVSAVRQLTEAGWHVEAEGRLYRQGGKMSIDVTSGIDWFELHGKADFDGQTVSLPKVLAALKKGEKTILLGDGSLGLLPETWLKQFGVLAAMGTEEEDHLRFARTQIGLLDALLASQPEANCDAVFQNARKQLLNFTGVQSVDAPKGFVGQLRPYQRDGLGWMEFLRQFGFGGCLADDMGLGKTVQVLALLEQRRARRETSDGSEAAPQKRSTLVVVPRSLIFNWIEESSRFSPKLKVLDHTGLARTRSPEVFSQYDVVLTTYGTLRNDIEMIRNVHFDYIILDEAQAIKNAASGSAKAVRLLQGDYRLALSGTPVQNHLGELWSLFEFLNPGMLGSARAFDSAGGQGGRVIEPESRDQLSRALRPFILRRTKAQVASDLPARIEQTIHCQLEGPQRKLYDELRLHYRQALLDRVEKEGINKSKIQILEALLRLRQVACHPGLIDKSQIDQPSAKLDALLPQLAEVADGNHKALVFSQFTSLLAIVRNRLDRDGVVYEYLDGKTRDRAECVRRFQTDDNCKIFLISLKAGGLGLNLTAAEYVFLLDPWWNPAVEAQAIDRAHRIGQSRQVFAYRLIASDTVEEKVVQLQATKRELADAIINADNSVMTGLEKEDLQMLLS